MCNVNWAIRVNVCDIVGAAFYRVCSVPIQVWCSGKQDLGGKYSNVSLFGETETKRMEGLEKKYGMRYN